jgi:hypothetical protein
MAGKDLDTLAKDLAEGRVSRRGMLKWLGGALLGGSLLTAFSGAALAAPQTCVTCNCGTGNPCNMKSSFCTEVRAFPADTTCAQACAKKNQNLCSAGQSFYCPHGCP